ncbi:MAG: DUF2062 domain-containing protein [Parvibaculales bacterium]
MFKRRKPKAIFENIREWIWPKSGWKRATQYVFHRLIRLDDGPQKIALGMACGAFASASPLVGTHFITAGILALIFGGNIIASTIGTWVGNPLTFPFIWLSTHRLGLYFLGQDTNAETPQITVEFLLDAPISALKPILIPMFVGALPVGVFLALVTYFPSLWAVKGYKLAKQKRKLAKKSENG